MIFINAQIKFHDFFFSMIIFIDKLIKVYIVIMKNIF